MMNASPDEFGFQDLVFIQIISGEKNV